MKIDTRQVGRVAVLKLGGRLTLGEVALLDEVTRKLLEEGARYFILNMIDVTDISSTGISRMVSLKRTVEGKEGALVLAEVSGVVDYVLDLAGMREYFTVYATEAEALSVLGR